MNAFPKKLQGLDHFEDENFPLAVSGASVARAIPPHSHDFVEMVYVISGRSRHALQAASGAEARTFEIMAGDIFVISPNEEHAFVAPDDLKVYNIMFMPELLSAEFAQLRQIPGLLEFMVTEPFFRLEAGFRYKLHLTMSDRAIIEALIVRCMNECQNKAPGYRLMARGAFVEMLILLGRIFSKREGSEQKDMAGKHSAIQAAVAFIEEKFAENISLDDIACQVYLSPNYFSRLFKDTTGISPWDYVTRIRIDEACNLLTQTDRSMTDITFDVGFGDSAYFSRVFKAQEGCTPSQFRKTVK